MRINDYGHWYYIETYLALPNRRMVDDYFHLKVIPSNTELIELCTKRYIAMGHSFAKPENLSIYVDQFKNAKCIGTTTLQTKVWPKLGPYDGY